MPFARSRYPDPVTDPTPERGSPIRSVALGIVVFGATLILLFGALNVVRRSDSGTPAASSTQAVASRTPTRAPASPEPNGSTSGSAAPSADPSASASVSASPAVEATLVGAGDIADCGLKDDLATAALVAAIPGAVFTAGDNAYQSGTAKEFHDCYDPTWGAFRDRTRPAPGNHDWVTKDLAGYLGYFGTAAAPNGTSWYSYELGAWHVIVLDSDCSNVGGCDAGSPQGRWLAADLKASSAQCTLAIWHHPRFSSGFHGNDAEVGPFWKALYDGGADLIINGHDHDYERFAPQDSNGHADGARGIREFVVGTGGAELRPFFLTRANSELRYSASFGVIRLDLHRGSYNWQFVPTKGTFSDSGTASCH